MQNATALCADLNTTGKTGEVIPSVAIDRIIAQRNAGIAAFMAGLAQIQEAQALFKGGGG